jgi:plastocyanin
MSTNSHGNAPRIVTLWLAVVLAFSLPVAHAETFSVEGKVKIFKKGGKRTLWKYDNAIAYLEGVSTPAPAQPAEVDQRKKKFLPRILPVVQGQVVRFHNQDRVEHNVFSTEKKNTFDLGRYPRGEYRDQVYDQAGLYKVYCNIHKKMILDVLVVPNRYFAATDKKGNYRITGVPAGEYMLKVWHIYGGLVELPISIQKDTVLPELSLTSTRVVREIEDHLDKEGKKYKSKPYKFYK